MTKRQELFVWMLVMVGIMAIILYACATIGAPPFPEDLCDDFDASQSVILKIATDNNLQLNEIYWGFVNSARLVAAFSESPQETKDFYKLWLNKIREF